ncbi:hypothetical protein BRD19_12085 [Halobacteriales archaeon SW_7_65_23]|nr:MAG: hypothetical protein BRD19_12085 [Halobacteriales archaeon SW_7_65_23]
MSSLCIQAIQAFLDLTEVALVVTDGNEEEVVDNTVHSLTEDRLVDLAEDALDREPVSVTINDTPSGAEAVDKRAVSILVTECDGSTFVLLALVNEATSLDEEDVQLLKLGVAHAATAIERIHERRRAVAEADATGSGD